MIEINLTPGATRKSRGRGPSFSLAAVLGEGRSFVKDPFLIGAIVSLLVPWILIFFTALGLVEIYLIQLAVFAIVTALLMPASVRTALLL